MALIVFGDAKPFHLPEIVRLLKEDELGRDREVDDPEAYEAAFEEIAKDPNQLLMVGIDGAEVVATLQLTLIPNLTLGGTKRAQIEGVRVASSHRGRGIGRNLVGRAVDSCSQRRLWASSVDHRSKT